ncbi:MAG: nucleotide exchange factor GrpE [Pseudomonadota bacterium]|nr:MAG: nucleotide exchange factor GrpE [Pseudomonadota bacterium]
MKKDKAAPTEQTTDEVPADQEAVQETAQVEPTKEEAVEATAELEARLAEAEGKAVEHWDLVLRSRAELENVQRRAARDLENAHKYALERFAQELLPVKDSLELGLNAVAEGEGEGEQITKLREGTELTLKMLSAAMEKFGIQEVNPQDEPFNPELHHAMTMQESREKAPNTVLSVMQKGYLLNDRVIRPAMVIVSKAAPAESDANADEQA